MNDWRELLPFAIMIIASLLVEHMPKLREWFAKLSSGWRFVFMLVISAAQAIGLALNAYLYSGVGLTWAGLGDAVMTAIMAWLTGQGYRYVERFFQIRVATKKRIDALEAR